MVRCQVCGYGVANIKNYQFNDSRRGPRAIFYKGE